MDSSTPPQEILLSQYLASLWRRKVLIVSLTIAGVFAALAVDALSVPLYEGTATVMLSPSKIGDSSMTTSMVDFLALMSSRSIAGEIVDQFDLGSGPLDLDVFDFLDEALRVEQMRGTSLIAVTVRLNDAELAAEVANRYAERAVDLNREINQEDTVEIRDFISEQVEIARDTLDTRTLELVTFESEFDVNLGNQEVRSLLDRIVSLNEDQFSLSQSLARQLDNAALTRLTDAEVALAEFESEARLPETERLLDIRLGERQRLEDLATDLTINIEAAKGRLAQAETEIAGQDKILEARTSIDSEPVLMEAARSSSSSRNGAGLLELSLLNEFLNPTFQVLEEQIVTERAALAGYTQQLEAVRRQLVTNDETLDSLQAELSWKNQERGVKRRERFLASDEYLLISGTSPSGLESQIRVVSAAVDEARQQLRVLQTTLNENRHRLERLELDHRLAISAYSDLQREYADAQLDITSRSSQLQIVDIAQPRSSPVHPRALTNVVLAALTALLASILLALTLEYATPAARATD